MFGGHLHIPYPTHTPPFKQPKPHVSGKKKRLIAYTHLQATNARKVFPCYDEPEFKANFTISIARYSYEICHSNMPIASTSDADPNAGYRIWDNFQTTPIIPTYLVAFINSEFENVTHANKKISIWMRRKGYRHDAAYGLEEAEKIFSKMENYTNLAYPLPKLDYMAIPLYLRKMENIGLVMMDESVILFDNQICPLEKENAVSRSITFVTAGQWLGTYTTMKWWDYVWLTKGLAKYLEYHLKAMLEPSWRLDDFFMVKVQVQSFYKDFGETRPLTYEVTTPDEISDAFDSISFLKGASFYKMLERLLSPPSFHKAIRKYFALGRKNKDFTTPEDLIKACELQIHEDKIQLNFPKGVTFNSFVNDWTESVSYPIIHVSRISDKNDEFNDIIVDQMPFSEYPGLSSRNWTIPLTFTKKSAANFNSLAPPQWSLPNSRLIMKQAVKKNEWIIFNLQRAGFYRVNYDLQNWDLLIEQLHTAHEKINVLNRLQLVDDSFNIAFENMTKLRIMLELTSYLQKETDGIPLMGAIKVFYHMRFRLNEESRIAFEEFFISCLEHQFERLGFYPKSTDDHLTTLTRAEISKIVCHFDSEACVDKARGEYQKHVHNLYELHRELRYIVLCTEVRYNSSASDELDELIQNTDLSCELELLLKAYVCYDDEIDLPGKLSSLLEKFSHISIEIMKGIFEDMFTTKESITIALQFIEERISNLRYNELDEIQTELLTILAKTMEHKIYFEEQVEILKKLLIRMKTIDQEQFGRLSSSIQKSLAFGLMSRPEINENELRYLLGTEEYCLTPYDTKNRLTFL